MDNNMIEKIFIATPAYEGKVLVQYAMSLIDLCKILDVHAIQPIVRVPVGSSLLVADRNRLVEMFWESGADYMLCIDNDLGFDARVVLKMLSYKKDFVAGVYPSRDGSGFTFRPVTEEDGRIVIDDETKLLKMEYIPAGFMLIKRNVIAKMRETYPELWYSPKDPRNKKESAFCFFDTEVWEGEFWGEDYVFCRRVRNAGFDIWVDPLIEFDHAGIRGALIQSLTTKKENTEE
jgi:hypothetical protein